MLPLDMDVLLGEKRRQITGMFKTKRRPVRVQREAKHLYGAVLLWRLTTGLQHDAITSLIENPVISLRAIEEKGR
jgi:hypothetical protein